MRLPNIGRYLIIQASGGQAVLEMKGLEWVFIAVRWLGVLAIFLMAWLHNPSSTTAMLALGGVIGLCNAVASLLNVKIQTPGAQRALGTIMLAVDTLIAWGVIILFAREFYTPAYAGFIIVIIEAATRFQLAGSMGMTVVFALGLYGAFVYRQAAFDVRFSTSGYVFWIVLMLLVALPVGMVVREGQRLRSQSERHLRDKTLLMERQRIARELHDSVLKTLQGLVFEAHVLESKASAGPAFVAGMASYIEGICQRTSEEIRQVIYELRGSITSEGIGSQTSGILHEWSKVTGIASEFTLSGRDVACSPEVTRNVRIIVSEALTNVQRHASASHVRMTLTISPSGLDIEISDNGCGLGRGINELHTMVSEGKLGIAGMKERAELLGGRLLVKSDQDGTEVRVTVPFRRVCSEQDGEADGSGNRSHS